MKDINIKFIPQSEQRFNDVEQVGDYWETDTSIEFRITKLPNVAFSQAILLHELIEKFRNNQLGITDASVDAFDSGPGAELDDPGLSPDAPYHKTHMEADVIERAFIIFSGNDWAEYEKTIDDLFPADSHTPIGV
jgi:hypothetical protein